MVTSIADSGSKEKVGPSNTRALLRRFVARLGPWGQGPAILRDWKIYAEFFSPHYQQHNVARLQHLDSLGLDLRGKSVLEIGAGIGDHSLFYLHRNCRVVAVEGRPKLAGYLRKRLGIETLVIDLDQEPERLERLGRFDIVHCYGLLYHLSHPERFLSSASCIAGCLLLETCVSYGPGIRVDQCRESRWTPSQALHGIGCRPTREWVFQMLKSRYDFVYATRTQPRHPEFPIDWTSPGMPKRGLKRAVFVASHSPICNPNLVSELPYKHELS